MHPVPANCWVLYPLLDHIRTAVLRLGLAKSAYSLFVVYLTKFLCMALQEAGGFSHGEWLEKVAALCGQVVEQSTLVPMDVLAAASEVIQIMGKDTVFGIGSLVFHGGCKPYDAGPFSQTMEQGMVHGLLYALTVVSIFTVGAIVAP